MKENGSVVFNITNGPSRDRIIDVFKYPSVGLDSAFQLQKADAQPSGGSCSDIQTLGTDYAFTGRELFFIDLIEYSGPVEKRTIRLRGHCNLLYKDADGNNGNTISSFIPGDPTAYHVDFDMTYNAKTRKGIMSCSHFEGYCDPYGD